VECEYTGKSNQTVNEPWKMKQILQAPPFEQLNWIYIALLVTRGEFNTFVIIQDWWSIVQVFHMYMLLIFNWSFWVQEILSLPFSPAIYLYVPYNLEVMQKTRGKDTTTYSIHIDNLPWKTQYQSIWDHQHNVSKKYNHNKSNKMLWYFRDMARTIAAAASHPLSVPKSGSPDEWYTKLWEARLYSDWRLSKKSMYWSVIKSFTNR